MLFSKEHLSGHYDWTIKPANSLFAGSPSRRLFDRWNGAQVLFIINAFATLSGIFSIEEGRKVESLIANQLPLNTCSELSVFNWLSLESLKI